MTKYLVTSALPYANGPLHFGHLAGAYLPADIFTRHQRQKGVEAKHISGSDEHGVAIMLGAQKEKVDYQTYVDRWHKEHKELFAQYQIDFDFFGRTTAQYHYEETTRWFTKLHQEGLIETKDSQQLYCQDCKNHLPDRFVEGTCYKCKSEGARGDECPHCGTWIEPEKLIDPKCKICGSAKIEEVTVNQYYLMLSKYHRPYREWLESNKGRWRKTVYPFVDSLSKEDLHDRAISRDLDWGIDVPLPEANGKKLYVWFDAPIGYVSNLKQHLEESGSSDHYIDDWWKNSDTRTVHFIGKDNIIFHALTFPVMAMGSGFITPPYDVPANQYLNLAGKQFSKSSGNYVDAREALDKYGVDALRYYLINIIPEVNDSSFTWEGFEARVNNELANNIGNLVNRCLKFLDKNWPEGLPAECFSGFVESKEGQQLQDEVREHLQFLDRVQLRKGIERVMAIGQLANNFFTECAPWGQIKEDQEAAGRSIAYTSQYILVIGILLAPYLPTLSQKIVGYFGERVDDSSRQDIYLGELLALKKIFSTDLKLTSKPKVLVPKVELS
ncbi:MAG: methionine--tRNA ligase [Bdellovibrionales bacterium]|jgi:methionyl-tRNA synthetase|nr:methionine--tRNA ligase [Bdellovibrionales bacterium]MBT3525824.1 methionine--tRNA ligase [Bdellovibrionales bacterium]MBT7768035.1 methionine--tRNA ligase [Bdellovibrionales bacterium]